MSSRLLIPTDPAALRRNNFDAIRLAMALLVVWSHSFALWFGSEDGEPVSRLMAGTYNSGNIGVLAFFAISGFLITLSWTRAADWQVYLTRRVARIYPGYLVAITLCSVVVVPLFSSRAFGQLSGNELGGIASNLLLRNYIVASDAFDHGAVNGSLWSIPFEFWCYLGIAALGLAGLLRQRAIVPLLALAIMLLRIWLDLTGRRPGGGLVEAIIGWPYLWFVVAPPFLLGAAIYLYRDRIPRSAWLLGGLVGTTIALANLPLADPWRDALTRFLLPPALAYAIFYAAFSARLRLHGAARFGDFSYGTYLYAFPIQQMLVAGTDRRLDFPVFVALAAVASLSAGIASWYLVEHWFVTRTRGGRGARPLDAEAAIVAP